MLLEKHIVLQNDIRGLSTLATAVEAFAEQADIGMKAQFSLNLSLDELFTNIVNYAYDDNDLHQIEIVLSYAESVLNAKLIDDGKAFDPTHIDNAELDATIDERKIGGLGIHFVRNFMDTMEYHRIDGQNQLLLKKDLSEF